MSLSTDLVLKLLIGLVLCAIVVASAVAVSLVTTHLRETAALMQVTSPQTEQRTQADEDAAAVAEREAALARMEQMHVEGYAEPTADELQRMREMHTQTLEISDEERRALLEKVQSQ